VETTPTTVEMTPTTVETTPTTVEMTPTTVETTPTTVEMTPTTVETTPTTVETTPTTVESDPCFIVCEFVMDSGGNNGMIGEQEIVDYNAQEVADDMEQEVVDYVEHEGVVVVTIGYVEQEVADDMEQDFVDDVEQDFVADVEQNAVDVLDEDAASDFSSRRAVASVKQNMNNFLDEDSDSDGTDAENDWSASSDGYSADEESEEMEPSGVRHGSYVWIPHPTTEEEIRAVVVDPGIPLVIPAFGEQRMKRRKISIELPLQLASSIEYRVEGKKIAVCVEDGKTWYVRGGFYAVECQDEEDMK
jgi:hypothetical protein